MNVYMIQKLKYIFTYIIYISKFLIVKPFSHNETRPVSTNTLMTYGICANIYEYISFCKYHMFSMH